VPSAGSSAAVTDYGEEGATPIEDAVVDDPPTLAEVAERQREQYPEQAPDQPADGALDEEAAGAD
jgi:hypothetical protein